MPNKDSIRIIGQRKKKPTIIKVEVAARQHQFIDGQLLLPKLNCFF